MQAVNGFLYYLRCLWCSFSTASVVLLDSICHRYILYCSPLWSYFHPTVSHINSSRSFPYIYAFLCSSVSISMFDFIISPYPSTSVIKRQLIEDVGLPWHTRLLVPPLSLCLFCIHVPLMLYTNLPSSSMSLCFLLSQVPIYHGGRECIACSRNSLTTIHVLVFYCFSIISGLLKVQTLVQIWTGRHVNLDPAHTSY